MSVIVAVRKQKSFIIAADSAFEQCGLLQTAEHKVNHSKIYKLGQTLIGIAGPALNHNIFEDIIKRKFKWIDFSSRHATFTTLLKLHPILKTEYFITTSTEQNETAESSQLDMLIVNPDVIIEVENHREVNEFRDYWAIGSGAKYALGSLASTYSCAKNANEIAIEAVKVACSYDPACRLPHCLLEVK